MIRKGDRKLLTSPIHAKVKNRIKHCDIKVGDIVTIVPNDAMILEKRVDELLKIGPGEVAIRKPDALDQSDVNIYKCNKNDLKII